MQGIILLFLLTVLLSVMGLHVGPRFISCRNTAQKSVFVPAVLRRLSMSVIRDENVKINVQKNRFRKATKQLATLGPASSSFEMIEKLFLSGADVFRLNFSHGENEEKTRLVEIIRAVEKKYDHPIAILGDLQGPKLRVGKFFNDEKVTLEIGKEFKLDMSTTPGDSTRVQLPHPEILNTLKEGDVMLLDDGKLRLRVKGSTVKAGDNSGAVTCVVEIGGVLSSRKGVNTPTIILPISALTPKDREDLEFMLTLEIDWVALSFVQTPEDVREFRALAGNDVKIMAKLEKPSAIDHLEEIVQLCDGIMVARGDLGVEMNPWDVPLLQKKITKVCKKLGKPCVIATQMMESMIESPTPTRAEASDCATAIFDSADAVMLSAESAAGKYPVESVTMQQLIINKIEGDDTFTNQLDNERIADLEPNRSDPSIAITLAASKVADISNSKALLCFTCSGGTVMRASRFRPNVPIIAACYNKQVARQMALVWGVYPILIEKPINNDFVLNNEMVKVCKAVCDKGYADPANDVLTITAGLPFGTVGVCNYMRVISAAGPDHWFDKEERTTVRSYSAADGLFR